MKMNKSPATIGRLIKGDLPKGCLVYDVPFVVVKLLVVTGFFVVVDGIRVVVVVVVVGVQHSPTTDSPMEVQVWSHFSQQILACLVQ